MWYRHQESNEAEKLLGFFVLFLRGGSSPQWLKPLLSDPHPLLALPLPAAPTALLTWLLTMATQSLDLSHPDKVSHFSCVRTGPL